jgi:hypothetical protein
MPFDEEEMDQHGECAAEIARLRAALIEVVDLYCSLVNSGDAGFWDPEKVDEIKHARVALGGHG